MLVLIAGLGLPSGPAVAAHQTVLGRTFLVKDPRPSDATRRRVKVVAREPAGTATIVGDPTVDGATLFVVASDASTPAPESGVWFVLPRGGWTALAGGFIYRDPEGVYGPVNVVRVREDGKYFRVKAVLSPRGTFALPIVPPAPGTDGGATLALTGGDAYCMRFGGPAGGVVKNVPADVGDRVFKITRPVAEAGCVHCSDQGGGVCGGACGPQQFCVDVGQGCQCIFIFGSTTTTTSTSTTSCPTPTALYCGVSGCAPLPALCPSGMSCQTAAEGCGCVGAAIPCGDPSLGGLTGDFCQWGSCPAGTTCGRVAKADGCGFDCACQ